MREKSISSDLRINNDPKMVLQDESQKIRCSLYNLINESQILWRWLFQSHDKKSFPKLVLSRDRKRCNDLILRILLGD